ALAQGGVIGRDNRLPWRLPPDLRRFKRLTMGHPLLLGRRTFESIGRPLPGRTTVVITRRPDWAAKGVPPGVIVARSVPEALSLARAQPGGEEVFVAGGAEVYRETLALADRLHLTRIEADFPGDTFFPAFDPAAWRLVEEERHGPGEEAPFAYRFEVWER